MNLVILYSGRLLKRMNGNDLTICHPLRPMCVLLNMVSAHLYQKNFMSPNLCPPLLPEDTEIRFMDAVPEKKQITADPAVSYRVGDLVYSVTQHGAMTQGQLIELQGSVTFEVSTASEALTQELAFEVGSLCMAMRKTLQPEQCLIKGAQISTTKLDPRSTFFLATTSVGLSLGYPTLNVSQLEGMLREVRIKIDTPVLGG